MFAFPLNHEAAVPVKLLDHRGVRRTDPTFAWTEFDQPNRPVISMNN